MPGKYSLRWAGQRWFKPAALVALMTGGVGCAPVLPSSEDSNQGIDITPVQTDASRRSSGGEAVPDSSTTPPIDAGSPGPELGDPREGADSGPETGQPLPDAESAPDADPKQPSLADQEFTLHAPCGSWLGNVHTFEVEAFDEVTVTVDTADAAHASDLMFSLTSSLGGSCLVFADDDFGCTYPPPDYRCPHVVFDVPLSGMTTLYLYVAMGGDSCTDRDRHRYRLTVLVNDQPVLAPLVQEDYDVFDVSDC